MKQSFETFAPLFPGFYGTIFEYDRESEDIDSYNEEYKTNLKYEDFEFNYVDYHQRICKAFVNRLEKEIDELLPIKIEYQSLCSPREYNFGNDSIYVKVTVDLKRLINAVAKLPNEEAVKYFDRYTNRSGFISFHSNNLSDWLNQDYIMEEPAHRIGALLDCLCTVEWGLEQIDLMYWVDSEMWIDFDVKEPAK